MEQRVLGGRYLLKDKVGTGGMATVYRAQDQTLNRTVAVKIMLPQYASDATFAARFKQEAQAAASLSSPYIVGVYDWGKDGNTYYIVMEYLRGTDLKSGIRSHGALDPKKVAQIGSQICGALSVAHNHEIIHRDIKPQNIMVLPDGNIKVMDFGIARAKNSHLTQDNNVLGTAHYVSPEQTRGQELGPTSDLYSLGIVMYECATGRVPFDGDDAISVAMKQVSEQPVPPSQINPKVDADLERIILKCMEKDPANRFQTADELRSVLNNYLAGKATNVGEPTRVIAASASAPATKVMGEKTTAMPRPARQVAATARPAAASPSNTGSYENEKKGGKGKVIAAIVAALAVLGVVVAFATGAFNGTKTATVPNVLNQEQEAAVSTVKKAGFDTKIEQSYSDDVDEGKVMEQTPDGNTEKEKGSTVTLVISKGAKPVEKVNVPNLVGMTSDEAKQALENLGLVASPSEENNDADEGKVFEQETAADTQVDKGTTVKYKVSLGPDLADVPGVLNYSESDASNMLSNAGFNVKVAYSTTYNANYTYGYVIGQDTTGQAAPGSTVTITVYHGQKPQETTSSVPNITGYAANTAASMVQNAGFKYWLVDTNGNTLGASADGTVISYTPTSAKAGDTIKITVQLSSNNTMNSGNGGGSTVDDGTEGSTNGTTDGGDLDTDGNVMNNDNY